ncbi:rCG53369, partial [Rattus norvegicus]
MQATHA